MRELNLPLAFYLAWRGLARQPIVATATVIGVAIAMSVVGSILIVDHHSATSPAQIDQLERDLRVGGVEPTLVINFIRRGEAVDPVLVAPQRGDGLTEGSSVSVLAGEEDYQAMRLAVRLGSLLAFGVGAVIVFYTLRFSVAMRAREMSLLRCLGESRSNVAASLLIQALGFGLLGTLLGLVLSVPFAVAMLEMGISTTGRMPVRGVGLPLGELFAMSLISIAVALAGVVNPIRVVWKQDIATSLNPRFISSDVDERSFSRGGLGWLAMPMIAAAYLAFRPFLKDWISVVQFLVVEVVVLSVLTFATLWLVPSILRAALVPFERLLMSRLPLEALLVGRRMRLTSQSLVFTIGCVALAFSLLTALHDVTAALKNEIREWSGAALDPYTYFETNPFEPADPAVVNALLEREGLELIRVSDRLQGSFPLRIVHSSDVNPRRVETGRPLIVPGKIILSRTLASLHRVEVGDGVIVDDSSSSSAFEVIEIADDMGFFARDGPYVNLKLYAAVSEGNQVFSEILEPTLGRFLILRNRNAAARGPSQAQINSVGEHFQFVANGAWDKWARITEIDRDFLIFDFILIMTVLLVATGVTNNMLIQIHSRRREISVLRTIGVDRLQTVRLVLLEGLVIGIVGATLALVLGHVIGAISVSFLDQFTLFEYVFVFSVRNSVAIVLLAATVCAAAAIYPALVAPRISSAESLHYE